jgi:hypothetical protein
MKSQVQVLLMGSRTAKKKDGTDTFTVDLYMPGAGAFDKTVTAADYVKFAAMPPSTPLALDVTYAVREEKINLDSGRSFSVRRLGISLGDLALVENARKAS